MEQEPIDVARATPAPDERVGDRARRKGGLPLWSQLLLSLVVIGIAIVAWIAFFPGSHTMLARIGITLPQGESAATAQPATQTAQAAPQGGGQAVAQGGARPNAGQGGQGGQGAARAGGGGAGGRAAPVVVTETVAAATINTKLTAIGEGSALNAVTITSASGGTLVEASVKPGDRVEAGAKLAALDSDTQQIAYDRAKLASTDADAALARTEALSKSNSVTTVQLDAARLAADNARLELRNAELALNQRIITTPIAGTVGLIQVTPGNLINAQTVFTTVEDSSAIRINFWVPERYASQIGTGMAVAAESVALPGQVFDGTVDAVDNRIDPASRTLQVQASIPNESGAIRAGMSFSVALDFPGESYPAVDPLSIQWSSDGAYVWKVVDSKVQKAMVEIIQRNTDGVLVKGDVALGDQVVTQGVLQLTDGATIKLLEDAGVAAPGGTPAGTQRRG